MEPQLRKAKYLAPDFVFFDRAMPDSTEKSFQSLYDAARRQVQRGRTELNRDALTSVPKVAPITEKGGKGGGKGKSKDKKGSPPQEKKPCLFFAKAAGCKFGEACHLSHAAPPAAGEQQAERQADQQHKHQPAHGSPQRRAAMQIPADLMRQIAGPDDDVLREGEKCPAQQHGQPQRGDIGAGSRPASVVQQHDQRRGHADGGDQQP